MSSTSTSKGTRKTYSFEEREILVNLIAKYLNSNNNGNDNEDETNNKCTETLNVWSSSLSTIPSQPQPTPPPPPPMPTSSSSSSSSTATIASNCSTSSLTIQATLSSGSTLVTMPKRKSLWSQLTEEYNALVGPENSRSSIQLRRCWENMKANKRNRDDKRDGRANDGNGSSSSNKQSTAQELTLPSIPGTLGLPPNVVFQPKESESFAFEGLMMTNFRCNGTDDVVKKERDEANDEPPLTTDVLTNEVIDHHNNNNESSSAIDGLPCDSSNLEPPLKRPKKKTTSPSRKILADVNTNNKQQTKALHAKSSTKIQRVNNNDMYDFTISEAQLKLETAALLKEEARLKLEEAEYRKEEARMRMICATYKLQKLREECEVVAVDDEREGPEEAGDDGI